MPKLKPVSWRKFVQCLKSQGFVGPYQIGKHPYMICGTKRITIPNEHNESITVDLLVRLLRQIGITREDWMKIVEKQ